MLGFTSHRPEKLTEKGLDNLWGITGGQYWTIFCKNDVNLERDYISKKKNGQLVDERHGLHKDIQNPNYP